MSDTIKKADEFIEKSGLKKSIKKPDSSLYETIKKLEALKKGVKDINFRIIFAFDTTQSMYPCIERVRSNIEKVVDELLTRENNIDIMVAGVGEYGDKYTMQIKPYSNQPEELRNHIRSIEKTYGAHPIKGGTGQVSLELLFQELNKKYISGIDNALVVVTDQIAHGQDDTVPDPRADYRKELFNLKKHLKGFYFVSCSDDHDIISLQKQLVNAENPNEKFINFDEFDVLTELLIALTKKSISKDKFEDYMKRLEQSTDQKDKIAAKKIEGYLK